MSDSTGPGKALSSRLLAALDKIRHTKAVVVGDAIQDVYFGVVPVGYASKTLSPVVLRTRPFAQHEGGTRAVARHMSQFSDSVILRTPEAAVYKERFVTALPERRVLFEVITNPENPRLDWVEVGQCVDPSDVAVVLDYGHGLFAEGPWAVPRGAYKLVVNVQSNSWSRGYGDVYGWKKANRIDLLVLDENELRETLRDRLAAPEDADEIHCPNMVTMGYKGLRHSSWGIVPSLKVKCIDRTGAGDAALAMAALMTGAGVEPELVAHGAAIMGALKASLIWGNERPVLHEEFVDYVKNM